jgi:hypothetical protein
VGQVGGFDAGRFVEEQADAGDRLPLQTVDIHGFLADEPEVRQKSPDPGGFPDLG